MALTEMQKRERAEYLEQNLTITECSQRQPYVFISYASNDWEKVFKTAVVPLQKRYGMRVYADKAFDRVNDRWIVPMLRNIRAAEVVLAFVSQSYIESYACFLEMLTAVNSRRQIVFVALEEDLHLGDTTDQPEIERGAKSELMNQGANMVTNINNTANDIMRAMKSAYTNISTLVEQDALSKYDISDAFINFFRDAAVNRKSINDLNALRYTIRSVSSRVFDPAMAEVREPAPAEAMPAAAAALQPAESPAAAPAPAPAAPPVYPQDGGNTAYRPAGSAPQGGGAAAGIPKDKKTLIIGGAVLAAVLVVVLFLVLGGKGNAEETVQIQIDNGTYVGQVVDGVPEGYGRATYDNGNVCEGEWKAGLQNGTGVIYYADGSLYEGGIKNNVYHGMGAYINADGTLNYVGGWAAGAASGIGVLRQDDGRILVCDFTNGQAIGTSVVYRPDDGASMVGHWEDSQYTQDTSAETIDYEGCPYTGQLSADGVPEGFGVMTSEGMTAAGLFHEGKLSFGVLLGGDYVYYGEPGDDITGYGVFTYSNGNIAAGDWVSGKLNGYALKRYADGTTEAGIWKDDELTD